MITNLFRMKTI